MFLIKEILHEDQNNHDDDYNSVSSLVVDTEIDCDSDDMYHQQQPSVVAPPVKEMSSLPLEN